MNEVKVQGAKPRKAVKVGGKIRRCQLKWLGALNSNANCDIPEECQRCPWFISIDEAEDKREVRDKWEELGY